MLLTASDTRLADAAPEAFRRSWFGLMVLSGLWGAAMAYLYGAVWSLFGEVTGMPLMPAGAVAVATAGWLYRRAVGDLARTLAGGRPGGPAAAAIVVLLAMAMLGLQSHKPDWPVHLPWLLHWIPRTMFRTLILAPLWGAWAMLITSQFCRPAERAEPAVAALAAGCGPMTAAACLLVPLVPTLYAYRLWGWWYLSIPAAAIAAATVGGWLVCRRAGGLTRSGLLAGNMLTQIAFVLAYLATIR